jgi:hypothetical protein
MLGLKQQPIDLLDSFPKMLFEYGLNAIYERYSIGVIMLLIILEGEYFVGF